MTARRHHYVPQCYLKGFTQHRDEPKLFVVDGKERRSFRTSPANVAAERDFHTIDAEGFPPDALENALSGFEGELSQALDRIIASRSIANENDRALLFNLISLFAVKSPRHREGVRSVHEQMLKRMMLLATATSERWESQIRRAKKDGDIGADVDTDYETMRDFVQRDKYKINLFTPYHLRLELQVFDKILLYIFGRKWILVKAPPRSTGFITSDHPMCLMWSDPAKRGGFFGPGLGLLKTQIVFPISNELAMIGAFEITNGEMDASKLLIELDPENETVG